MLEEWNQGRCHRNQLFRADVDVVHFVAVNQHEVAGLACVDQFGGDAPLLVEVDVGLRDGVTILFPCG